MNKSLLKQIALASVLPCPEIVPSLVFVRIADGFEYSAGGSMPWPSRVEQRGFCYYDKRENVTYGKRFASERAARNAFIYRQLRNAVQFLHILAEMSQDEQEKQADYWLKRA